MRRKRLAIGFFGIFSLIALFLIIVFLKPYEVASTIKFTSEHLIIGAVFLTLLRTLSNVLPAIPGGMIVFSTVPVLGWFPAFICNMIGILTGASIAFFLARTHREPLVERFASLNKIHKLEKQVSTKKQFMALVAFRLFTVPVVDISSYVVGLTEISYSKFALATFLASLPTLILYYFGSEVYKRIFGINLFVGIISILIIGSIYFIIKRYELKLKSKF